MKQKGTTLDSCLYDALGRMVEQNWNGSYTQFVYDPMGDKLGKMSGQALSAARVPLPGGGVAIYASSSDVDRYWHSDWQGSVRFVSSQGRALDYDNAKAPYGEEYAATGPTPTGVFAGLIGDTGGGSPLWDATFREYDHTQGRWLSPDPAGLAAADPTNPQSWNRYAYALNSPCTLTDPSGLDSCNFNIAINNQAGANLAPVEAQINAVLGAVPSTSGDTVGANFDFTGKADYTLNIVNGNPNGPLGTQSYFLGIPFLPGPTNVYAGAIDSVFSSQPAVINQVMGTVGAHELTHRIGGIGDLPPGQGLMSLDALTNQDQQQGTYNAYNLLASPGVPPGLQLTPGQVSKLYSKCAKKHPGGNVPGGGTSGHFLRNVPADSAGGGGGWGALFGLDGVSGGNGLPNGTVTVTQTVCPPGVHCGG